MTLLARICVSGIVKMYSLAGELKVVLLVSCFSLRKDVSIVFIWAN